MPSGPRYAIFFLMGEGRVGPKGTRGRSPREPGVGIGEASPASDRRARMDRARMCCRLWIVIACSVLLGPGSASAQNWIQSAFPERAFDFGTVARGSRVRHSFRVINTTSTEIHIANWRTKCGCTDVKVGAREIPPGTQTVVEATIDTSKFQGYKASGLTLILDRPQFLEVDLNLTCFIRGDVLLNPGIVDFGVVQRKSKPTVTLVLSYLGGHPGWDVTEMKTISPLVSAKLEKLDRSPGQAVQYQLVATLDSSAPSGYFKDEIALVTNDSSSPRIPISVLANVQSAVSISPSVINLGRVRAGQVATRSIMVKSSQPFKLTDLKARSDELTAKSSAAAEEARAMHTVTVTFKAPKQPGPFNTVLEISTDLTDEPPTKINAFATVTP
jgi:hypothetical protein